MDETIDKLQIEISSDSSEASNGLEKLIGTLNTIKAAVAPASDALRQLRDSISDLNKAVNGVNIEPMRDALAKIAESAAGFSGIDTSGIAEIGNAFTELSGSFGGADMNIGNQLLQFAQQLNSGMRELSGAAAAIDEGAMQKLVNIGATLGEVSAASNIGNVNTAGLTGLANSLSKAIPLMTAAGNMIDDATLERLRDFAYMLPDISDALGYASSGSGSGIASTVSNLYSLSDALSSLNSVALPSAQNLMNLRSALASFSGLRSNFDAAGLRSSISNIASAAQAISTDAAQRLSILGTALSKLNSNFANMKSLSLNDADALREAVLRIMDACMQIDESTLARLSALQGALSELRQSGGIQGLLDQSTQGSSKGSRGGIGSIGSIFVTASKGIQTTLHGVGDAVDWLRSRLSLSNTALGSFLGGLARIAKYRLLRTIIKGFTSGTSEGLKNLAHASSEANAMLTRLSTTSLLLKNSMGGALYSALATAMNWITAVGNAAARAIDMLSQFFAILGGRTTYMKAVSATEEFVDANNKATSSVKGLKQELMGFDEINALTPDRTGGSGRSKKKPPDYGAMFTEAPVSKWLKDMMDAGDFTEFGKKIAEKLNAAMAGINWSKIQTGAKKIVNSVTSAINGFFGEMNPSIWGKTIANAINTAANFVASFWEDTNWKQIGTKLKQTLIRAMEGINAVDLARAIVGRFTATATFLSSFLPSTQSEWNVITGKVSDILNEAIRRIPTRLIGTTIGNVITGGLSMINSLAKGMTLTNISTALKETLETAFNSITPEQIEETLQNVKKDIIEALKTIMSIKINIGSFEFSAVGAVIMASAVFKAIRGALSGVFSNTGFMSGTKGMMITGALAFGLDAMMKISDIKEALDNGSGLDIFSKVSDVASSALKSAGLILHSVGKTKSGLIAIGISTAFEIAGSISDLKSSADATNGITKEKVAEIIGSALKSAGLTLLVAGHPVTGMITFSVGIAIEPVVQAFSEPFANAPSVTSVQFVDDWKTQLDTIVQTANSVEQILPVFQQITGINLNMEQFSTMIQLLGVSMSGLGGSIDPVNQAYAALSAFFGAYDRAKQTGMTFEQFAREQFAAFGIIIDNTDGATTSTQDFIDVANSTSGAVSELNQSLNETGGAVEQAQTALGGLNDITTDNAQAELTEVGEKATSATEPIKGMGTEAETTSNKISLIPTDVAVNLEITNYTTLISNLDTINAKFTTITESVNQLRLKISSDLMTSLNTLNSKISTTLKNTLDDLDAQFGALKKSANSFQRTIDALHGTTLNIKVYAGLSSGAKSFLRSLQNLDSSVYGRVNNLLRYSQFASGGYPTTGQMFIANERGPELVGKIGNRTAVANEEQIGDAIFRYMDEYGEQGGDMNYDALAAAMVSALRSAGLGAVYLDGRMLAQSINRETARSGRPAITY